MIRRVIRDSPLPSVYPTVDFSAMDGWSSRVKIEKAIIHGDGWEQLSVLEQEVFMNTVFGKDDLLKGLVSERYFDHDLLLLGDVQLFKIKGDLLEKVYRDGGNIGIKVFYEIDGEEGVMNYELKRRVEKKNVYPT